MNPPKIKYILMLLYCLVPYVLFGQDAPNANNDNYSVQINSILNINTPGVLANDSDINGDSLVVTQFSVNGINYSPGEQASISQGLLQINIDGSFSFQPNTGFVGNVDPITYTISDSLLTDSANVNIIVEYPPTPPEANDDNREMFLNTTLDEVSPGLLFNDTDINEDSLSISQFIVSGITFNAGQTATIPQGIITINTNGSFVFTPNTNFVGNIDPINYVVSDEGLTSSANLNISVIYPPTPPVANDVYDTADINTTLNVSAPGVIINDTDINGDALTISDFTISGITYNPGDIVNLAAGSFTLSIDGSYTLIPTPNFTGELPIINYTITDGGFSASANLFISVEPTVDLLELDSYTSCNQGFTSAGEYKIVYTAVYRNRSNAKDYHEPSMIRNIDITNDLQATFGTGCIVSVDDINAVNNVFTQDYINGGGMPREFTTDAINDDFVNLTSTSVLNANAINTLTLYPRQNVTITYCVTVNAFCNGRLNPTPSGSGLDFDNIINATSNRGDVTESLLLSDFHSTDAVITAGLYIPEFNDDLDPPGVINPNGTYDYDNRVIITNEGSSTANNVNYNMGLGSFLDNGIVFSQISVRQVEGPPVNINPNYNGDTDTELLLPNNSLAPGEKIILELFYLIEPYNSDVFNFFYPFSLSQTQGDLDGLDETTPANKRLYSFVYWSDNQGNHLDRYYRTDSPTESILSSNTCVCRTASMRFTYLSSITITNSIFETEKNPNQILEHDEVTFEITIRNTSESVEIRNIQVQNDLNAICGNNLVSVSAPTIKNSIAQVTPTLNPNFNGVSDINIFNGSSGVIGADETVTIELKVKFLEYCSGINTLIFTAGDPFTSLRSSTAINIEAQTDSDGDGIRNTIDLDDDNDTIPDFLESNGLNPLDDDDADLIPNYRDIDYGTDANSDGVVDIFDFDGDGVANHLDLDSDNDGILDIVEAGNANLDNNRNGRTDSVIGNNGLDNTLETNDSTNATISYTIPNSDTDANLDYLDIDSDNDGIVDNIEAQSTAAYIAPNYIFIEGIDSAYPTGLIPIDTDGDLIFDFLDVNSDDDLRDDTTEAWDTDSDGTAEIMISNIDSDGDGLDDAFDDNDNQVNPTNNQTPLSFPNLDNDETIERDWREIMAIIVVLDNVSANENEELEFTISLVRKRDNSVLIESAFPINVNFSTSDGTTTTTTYNVATAPFDYDNLSNVNFTIPEFTTSRTIGVTSLEDNIFEQDELFTLTGTVTSNNTINSEIVGVGTIIDNDLPPTITMTDARGDEGTNITHTISISHPSSTPIIVEIVTQDNIAIQTLDYASFSDVLTIDGTIDPNNPNLETIFSYATFLDNLNESDEEPLNVFGTVQSVGNTGTQDLNKIGYVVDVDPDPFIEISSHKVEEGQPITFTIQLLNANNELMQNWVPINILLETIDETTTSNLDYESFSILTVIPALTSNLTQGVNTIDDRLSERTETFRLQMTVNLDNVSNPSSPFGIGTLVDNDYPNLFSPNSDGKSDVFKINNIVDEYPNFRLQIFNRLGNEIYNYSNNGNQNPVWWDGNYKGKPSPVGVYYYILDFNDGIRKPRKNFIQLIR